MIKQHFGSVFILVILSSKAVAEILWYVHVTNNNTEYAVSITNIVSTRFLPLVGLHV